MVVVKESRLLSTTHSLLRLLQSIQFSTVYSNDLFLCNSPADCEFSLKQLLLNMNVVLGSS